MIFIPKIFVIAAICIFTFSLSLGAASEPPPVGGQLPDIALSVPQSGELQLYLGVSGKQTFTIPEIKATIVLIEIFSMY